VISSSGQPPQDQDEKGSLLPAVTFSTNVKDVAPKVPQARWYQSWVSWQPTEVLPVRLNLQGPASIVRRWPNFC